LRSELAAALTASQGYFAKWQDCEAELAAEMAAHEEYRTKGQQHLADLKLSVDRYLREMAEEKAAHEATRKGLTQAHELLEAAQSDRDAALAELKATKARLDQWRLHFDAVRAKLDALRKELAAEQRNRIAQHGAYVATLAELEATKAELVSMTRDRDEWVGIAVERKTEREATRKAHERMAADWADAGRSLRSELTFRSGVISELNAKLEALRKPLEGGIEERISELYRHLEDAPTWSKSANEALDAIVAALRAKGEPQVATSSVEHEVACYQAGWAAAMLRHDAEAKGEPQAVEMVLGGFGAPGYGMQPKPQAVEPAEPSKRQKSEGMVLTADTYVAANSETGERARIVATMLIRLTPND
jgi:chromosome segregation ATPase